ncbi:MULTISPECIES: hypothetical protein [Streptomyces]|uniref:Uncharacterized protein n=1 Tax=Streptomyces eurythermus TaxID=42237 RepID=A0ABW6YQA9_9ACTN|nr:MULTISPECIES: hypothetical protein [Streptomyces]QIS74630.1 hypothetical protein HB370_35430 [Streptomyces sp. DSM 40868]
MDTAGLASAVVPLVVAAVTGAGTALGTETVQMVSGLVRERLGGSEQGRAALTGLDRAPDDSTAADRLHAALRDALDADPAFARRLFSLFEAPPPPQQPPAPPGSVVIGDGNRLRGSNISLGPLTISTTRGGPGALVALVALVLAIVALAVYGGVRAIGVDDSPGRGSGTASRQDTGGEGGAAGASADGSDNSLAGGRIRPVLKDRDVVKSVLPGLDAVPGGWTQESAPKVLEAGASRCRTDQPSVLFCGEAEYQDPSTNNVAEFEVYALSSVSAAQSAYRSARGDAPPSMALPALGDESHAFGGQDGSSGKTVMSVVRFGSVVVGVTYRIEAVDWTEAFGGDHLEVLTRMLVDRVRQACEGQAPTARAVL